MRRLILLAVAMLAACAKPDTPPPGVEIRTVKVDQIVPVACVKKEKIPREPAKVGDKLTGDARRDLDIVSASALRLRSWGTEMRAILIGCAD